MNRLTMGIAAAGVAMAVALSGCTISIKASKAESIEPSKADLSAGLAKLLEAKELGGANTKKISDCMAAKVYSELDITTLSQLAQNDESKLTDADAKVLNAALKACSA